MPSLYQFSEIEILGFILVFLRISSFIMAMPVLGTANVPAQVKVLFSLVMSFILFPTVLAKQLPTGLMDEGMIFLAIKEVTLGLMLGYLCRMFFLAVSTAGHIVSVTMGLSAAQLFNPTLGEQGSAVEQFYFTLAMLVFLAFNGHHLLISGLAQSFEVLPLSFDGFKMEGVKIAAELGQEILVIGLKISAPVLVAIFITNLSMGIIGRAVPQINVLVTSLHLTILVGLVVVMISLPLFVRELNGLQEDMAGRLFDVMKHL